MAIIPHSLRDYVSQFWDSAVLFLKFGSLPVREFQRCCEIVSIKRNQGLIGDKDFDTLYGLYKQARVGDCKEADFSGLSEEEIRRRNCWINHRGDSKKLAMLKYIEYAGKLLDKMGPELDQNFGVFSKVMIVESENNFEHDDFFTLVEEGELDKVEEILKNDPNMALINSPEGLTPLHLAADRGHLDMVKLLLKSGSKINSADENGDTPIHSALVSHQTEVVKLLIDEGADLDLRNLEGLSPKDIMILSNVDGDVIDSPGDLALVSFLSKAAHKLE